MIRSWARCWSTTYSPPRPSAISTVFRCWPISFNCNEGVAASSSQRLSPLRSATRRPCDWRRQAVLGRRQREILLVVRAARAPADRLLDRLPERRRQVGLPEQLDLGLRGVDVHVDRPRRHLHEQHHDRVAARRQQRPVRPFERLLERGSGHPAPIDEHDARLSRSGGSGPARSTNPVSRPAPTVRSGSGSRHEATSCPSTSASAVSSRPLPLVFSDGWPSSVSANRTSGRASAYRRTSWLIAADSALGLRVNFNRAGIGWNRLRTQTVVPLRPAPAAPPLDLARPYPDRRRPTVIVGAAGDVDLGHRRDARQRLASEPEGRDLQQIAHVVDLAGGVALERQLQLIVRDAVAVVRHADQSQPAPSDVDPHIRGARRPARCPPAP